MVGGDRKWGGWREWGKASSDSHTHTNERIADSFILLNDMCTHFSSRGTMRATESMMESTEAEAEETFFFGSGPLTLNRKKLGKIICFSVLYPLIR